MYDIEKHKNAVRDAVAERGLASFMNDTKWKELALAVSKELPFPPPYQRKDVLESTAYPPEFNDDVSYRGDWTEGILPFFSIEWICVRPRYTKYARSRVQQTVVDDCSDALRAILARYQIPFIERDDSFWIYGYAKGVVL